MQNRMYSSDWFETFAATVPASIVESDLRGITAALPLEHFPRILDVACGIGRIAAPLWSRGYAVTGLDISVEALRTAQQRAPGPRYIGLDQRHIGRMHWVFDGALVLWNSLGFAGRSGDLETLAGLAEVIRPGGKVVFDLYHPEWLHRSEKSGERDERGPMIRRWLHNGRCFHEIHYSNGQIDHIEFDVYQPEEIRELCARSGLQPGVDMVWWNPESRPSEDCPRYQLVCTRP
jgi:SAM-dependent methyltransferase